MEDESDGYEDRDCNPGIPDRFSIPKWRDYERPNAGISGL